MLTGMRHLRKRVLSSMTPKAVVLLIALALLGVIGIIALKSVSALQEPAPPGSLQQLANDARAQGVNELFQTVSAIHVGVDGVDEAVSHYSVVVAQPVAQSTHITDPYTFMTWYKFRVYETLSSRPYECSDCSTDQPFDDLLPTNADEILIPDQGGRVVVDGVTFNKGENLVPTYDMNSTYLLFVDVDSMRKIGSVRVGPVGVFIINGDTLRPVVGGSTINSDLSARYANSLSQFRSALSGSTPTPTPTPCNVPFSVKSRCERNGGTWDDESCTCGSP